MYEALLLLLRLLLCTRRRVIRDETGKKVIKSLSAGGGGTAEALPGVFFGRRGRLFREEDMTTVHKVNDRKKKIKKKPSTTNECDRTPRVLRM